MTHLLAEGGYQIFSLHNTEKTWLYFALVCAVASIVVACCWCGACSPPTRARPR